MRTKLGWTFAIIAYTAGVLLIVRQPAWWYPQRTNLPTATAVATPLASQTLTSTPLSLSLLAPEVKELFALYQRGTHHLPRSTRDFLLERLQSWSELSPDLQAETTAILHHLQSLDRAQALAYLQPYLGAVTENQGDTPPVPAGR